MSSILFSGLLAQTNNTIGGINKHSIELSQALYKPGKSMFCSPLSLSTALAMTYAGASGSTKTEFEKVMHYNGDETFVQMNEIDRRIEDVNKTGHVKLLLANALWNRIQLKDSYTKRLKNDFQAEFYPLTTAAKINEWADKNTNGKIPKVLEESDITPDMALVLTNAIYFKGNWLYKFDTAQTKKDWFNPAVGKKVKTDLMHSELTLSYFENEDYQMVQLPYEGRTLVMEIYLPSQKSSVPKMLMKLNGGTTQITSSEEVILTIPKFKLETEYNLIPTMIEMGLKQPFGAADFSLMSDQQLSISKLLQKAYVEVNEKGTEAAALTVVGMTVKSVLYAEPKKPKIFKADRPFFFVIKDKAMDLILFSGVIDNLPSE